MRERMTMAVSPAYDVFPRRLREKEWDLLQFVLPADRPGYIRYKDLLSSMIVLSQGRRGKGNLVMGFENDIADTTSPLPPVVAYGMVETTHDTFSITVREFVGDQIDVEIVSSRGDELPDHFEEKRRWTYSTWLPGSPSPATGVHVREIPVSNELVLAIARDERRLWICDRTTGMNHLIPVTNYYNELMLHKGIRDPKIALKSNLLFEDLDRYADAELRASFIVYNALRPRVTVVIPEAVPEPRGLKVLWENLFRNKS